MRIQARKLTRRAGVVTPEYQESASCLGARVLQFLQTQSCTRMTTSTFRCESRRAGLVVPRAWRRDERTRAVRPRELCWRSSTQQKVRLVLVTKARVLMRAHFADKNPSQDNNEANRSHWTNWCGPSTEDGSYLSPERCVELSRALSRATYFSPAQSAPSSDSGAAEDEGPPSHVFQILDHDGKVIVSFPKSEREVGGKRGYQVEDYGDLAREVIKMPRGAEDATTSCTRRYRKKHPVSVVILPSADGTEELMDSSSHSVKGGTLTTIESVVILYGSVTFACFQTGGIKYTSLPSTEFALEDVPTSERPSVLSRKRSASPGASDLPDDAKRPRTNKAPPPPTLPLPYPIATQPPFSIATSRHISQNLEQGSGAGDLSPTVASASAILGSFNQSPAPEATGYSPDLPPLPSASRPPYAPQGYPGPQPPVHPVSYTGPSPHPLSQSFGTTGLTPQQQQQLQQLRQVQQHQHQSQHSYAPPPPALALGQLAHASLPQPPSLLPPQQPAGVDGVPPPLKQKRMRVKGQEPVNKVGPKACESCGTVNSPEWRKGPGGVKSLCNACGESAFARRREERS